MNHSRYDEKADADRVLAHVAESADQPEPAPMPGSVESPAPSAPAERSGRRLVIGAGDCFVSPARRAASHLTLVPERRPPDVSGADLVASTLVVSAQLGDPAAYVQLMGLHADELLRLGHLLLDDLVDATEAVRETFLLAWQMLPSLTDPRDCRVWLHQRMVQRCLDRLPTAHPVAPTPSDWSIAPDDDVDAATHTLREAVHQLPARQRVCWALHDLHELTHSEIGSALGVPASEVGRCISQARLFLARAVASAGTAPNSMPWHPSVAGFTVLGSAVSDGRWRVRPHEVDAATLVRTT
jgi:RNA polymerase sigma-70 factor (ECF subfamily)